MDAAVVYLGLPTLFIMLCMVAVGWVSFIANRKFVQRLFKWVAGWGALGCFLTISLAIAAWVMNTDFVYRHARMVWPFRPLLIVLDGHPSFGTGLLLIGFMGVMNGAYYAILAALTWNVVRLLPHKYISSDRRQITGVSRSAR